MVQYYVTCKRELWFFANNINMNYNNDDIDIGKIIHEKSYSREHKEVRYENMVFDFIKSDDNLTIFEVKKSSNLSVGAKYQLYFYLYNMHLIKKDVSGVLLYPKERKREELILTSDIIDEMKDIIEDIPKIINLEKPPLAIKKHYCKHCSFFELCMI